VLYNIASVYATLAATERRAEIEGIKRALTFLTVSLLVRIRGQHAHWLSSNPPGS
jgi:hypothetical protein